MRPNSIQRCHLWTVALAGLVAGGLALELLCPGGARPSAGPVAVEARARASRVQVVPLWRTRTPSLTYTPEMVVGYQLEALRHVPAAAAGADAFGALEVVHRFASEANRRSTGPLLRFGAIMSGPTYSPMLGARAGHVREVAVHEEGFARVDVTVISREGAEVPYVFYLSREVEGPNQGAWVTDGVLRGAGGKPAPRNWMGQ